MPATASAEVVVLGAGPAGLGAALRLARAGRSVVVLERGNAVGGLAASFEVGGVRVDHGSHRLHPSTAPEILAVLLGLLGDDLQVRPRRGRLRLADRWVGFPPELAELAVRLPLPVAARLARDALTGPWRSAPRADTFAEVVRSTLGPTLAHDFYFPYVRKIWACEPSQLSGELARRRVGARSMRAILRRAAGRDPRRATFFYPRRGFGQIVEAIADAAHAAGATVLTGAEVTALRVGDEHVVAILSDGTEVAARRAFSTLPLPALPGLAGAPPAVVAAAASLEVRSLVLVYLLVATDRWTAFDAHYLPSPQVPMSRVSEPKNYRDSTDDSTDRTVLCAEVPCSVGDDVWDATDEHLGEAVADALGRVALPIPAVEAVVTRRVARAYPVYRVGFERAFDAVDHWAADLPSVVTFGRQGLFAHDNTHHALAMGWAAADALGRDAAFDQAAWSLARSRFCEHVVED
jgi:protoporphyrinogen oxidase